VQVMYESNSQKVDSEQGPSRVLKDSQTSRDPSLTLMTPASVSIAGVLSVPQMRMVYRSNAKAGGR
jgi:hypothetical protein